MRHVAPPPPQDVARPPSLHHDVTQHNRTLPTQPSRKMPHNGDVAKQQIPLVSGAPPGNVAPPPPLPPRAPSRSGSTQGSVSSVMAPITTPNNLVSAPSGAKAKVFNKPVNTNTQQPMSTHTGDNHDTNLYDPASMMTSHMRTHTNGKPVTSSHMSTHTGEKSFQPHSMATGTGTKQGTIPPVKPVEQTGTVVEQQLQLNQPKPSDQDVLGGNIPDDHFTEYTVGTGDPNTQPVLPSLNQGLPDYYGAVGGIPPYTTQYLYDVNGGGPHTIQYFPSAVAGTQGDHFVGVPGHQAGDFSHMRSLPQMDPTNPQNVIRAPSEISSLDYINVKDKHIPNPNMSRRMRPMIFPPSFPHAPPPGYSWSNQGGDEYLHNSIPASGRYPQGSMHQTYHGDSGEVAWPNYDPNNSTMPQYNGYPGSNSHVPGGNGGYPNPNSFAPGGNGGYPDRNHSISGGGDGYPRWNNSSFQGDSRMPRMSYDGDNNLFAPNNFANNNNMQSNFRSRDQPPRTKLPKFSGDTDWRPFYREFQRHARRYRWDADEMLDRLQDSLHGQARDFAGTLEDAVYEDFYSLVGELENRFGRQDLPRTARAELPHMKMGDLKMEEFAEAVAKKALVAYPEPKMADLRRETEVRTFLLGYKNPTVSFTALSRQPRTLAQAQDLIVDLESNYKGTIGERLSKVRQVHFADDQPERESTEDDLEIRASQVTIGDVCTVVENYLECERAFGVNQVSERKSRREQFEEQRARGDSYERKRREQFFNGRATAGEGGDRRRFGERVDPGVWKCHKCGQNHARGECRSVTPPRRVSDGCFRCGSQDHFIRSCTSPSPARSTQQSRLAGASPSPSRKPAECYQCGSTRHLKRDCPRVSPVRRPGECYECGSTRHFKRECPELRERIQSRSPSPGRKQSAGQSF